MLRNHSDSSFFKSLKCFQQVVGRVSQNWGGSALDSLGKPRRRIEGEYGSPGTAHPHRTLVARHCSLEGRRIQAGEGGTIGGEGVVGGSESFY